jgi:hypothetical protein
MKYYVACAPKTVGIIIISLFNKKNKGPRTPDEHALYRVRANRAAGRRELIKERVVVSLNTNFSFSSSRQGRRNSSSSSRRQGMRAHMFKHKEIHTCTQAYTHIHAHRAPQDFEGNERDQFGEDEGFGVRG